MNVLIRNVSPVAVKRIDQIAKEKGVSREEFLREQLEVISVVDLLQEQKEKINFEFDKLNEQLNMLVETLLRNEKNYIRMLELFSIMTGIDLFELEEFYDGGNIKWTF